MRRLTAIFSVILLFAGCTGNKVPPVTLTKEIKYIAAAETVENPTDGKIAFYVNDRTFNEEFEVLITDENIKYDNLRFEDNMLVSDFFKIEYNKGIKIEFLNGAKGYDIKFAVNSFTDGGFLRGTWFMEEKDAVSPNSSNYFLCYYFAEISKNAIYYNAFSSDILYEEDVASSTLLHFAEHVQVNKSSRNFGTSTYVTFFQDLVANELAKKGVAVTYPQNISSVSKTGSFQPGIVIRVQNGEDAPTASESYTAFEMTFDKTKTFKSATRKTEKSFNLNGANGAVVTENNHVKAIIDCGKSGILSIRTYTPSSAEDLYNKISEKFQ